VGYRYDLVVLGDLVADLIIPIERLPLEPNNHGWAEGIFVEPGGAGNVLVAAKRVNLAAAALGHLGADYYGTTMREMLAVEGVDMRHATSLADRATVLCIVLADRARQHVYLGVKDDKGLWPFPDAWHAVIREARALYTDGYTLRDVLAPEDVLAAMAAAREADLPVFFDPGPSVEFVPRATLDRAMGAADVILIAEPEAEYLVPDEGREGCARALLALGPEVVVLKLGADGCLLVTAGESLHVPGFSVPVVDTVGAGDSFAAAFVAGWLRGGSLRDSATLANAMGALVATHIPPRDRLLALLADHPAALALA
jgi:sugar/nucleoside kinase (ribokinase family)